MMNNSNFKNPMIELLDALSGMDLISYEHIESLILNEFEQKEINLFSEIYQAGYFKRKINIDNLKYYNNEN